MSSLISFGEAIVDKIEVERGATPVSFAGGAPANVAVCFSKLGGQSFFIGGLGDDDDADFLRQQLAKYSVNFSYSKTIGNSQTAKAIVYLDERNERSFQFLRDNTADIRFGSNDLISTPFAQSNLFHFCSNTLTNEATFETTISALTMAREYTVNVSFDVNLRTNLWQQTNKIEDRVSHCFKYCDLIKMSLDELDYLANAAGKSYSDYLKKIFSFDVSMILITDGSNPITCYITEESFSVATPAIHVEDTTAAGDAFIGGFLYSISKELNDFVSIKELTRQTGILKQALFFASHCGAITCQNKGAFSAVPSLDEVDNFIKNYSDKL